MTRKKPATPPPLPPLPADSPRGACPVCGGSDYTWGFVNNRTRNFFFEGDSVLATITRGGQLMRARRCDRCGNVQWFVRPS